MLTVALLAAALLACGERAGADRSLSVTTVELQVYAAASLKAALEQAKTAYEAAHPGVTITISTDSSAALATQIEQGAPADVFLSADTANPQKLVDRGFAAGDAVVFATNRLTIVVPIGNPAGIAAPEDLGRPGIRIIAAGDEVPIARYATQLIDNVAALTNDAEGFKAACAANVATKVDNVRAVIAQIELGEGDAAIVYATDAAASNDVETVNVPADVNVSASYAGVVVKASPNVAAARAFLDWFAGPEAEVILATLGFLPPAT